MGEPPGKGGLICRLPATDRGVFFQAFVFICFFCMDSATSGKRAGRKP